MATETADLAGHDPARAIGCSRNSTDMASNNPTDGTSGTATMCSEPDSMPIKALAGSIGATLSLTSRGVPCHRQSSRVKSRWFREAGKSA
jgi:hypothetical protein